MGAVAATTTREARGTPATPLLVTMRTSSIVTWVERGRAIPYAWAMKIEANAMYIIEPSRLKEYPRGSTKPVILSFTPNFPSASIVFGYAASLLAVEKATISGSFTIPISRKTRGPRTTKPAVMSTTHRTASAP